MRYCNLDAAVIGKLAMGNDLKIKSKKIIKKCLLDSGIICGISLLRSTGVVILRYHSVLENPQDLDGIIGCGIVHSAATFEQQMRLLSQSYLNVTMDDVLDFAKRRTKIPRRAVVVTFDDGFADNATSAVPIMARYGIRGTFYVTAGTIAPKLPPWFIMLRRAFHCTNRNEIISPLDGTLFHLNLPHERRQAFLQASSYCAVLNLSEQRQLLTQFEKLLDIEPYQEKYGLMMTEEQIKALHDAGHIIGSHTVSHSNIAHIPEYQIKEELESSKLILEEIIGTPITHFSYPSPILQPHYNESTVRLSREAGYGTAVTCTHGLVYPGGDPLVCRRITVPENFSEFRWSIEAALAGLPS